MAPVMAIILPDFLAKSFINLIPSSRFSSVTVSAISASTPLVLPLPSANVLISEILPRITSNFNCSINFIAVLVLSSLAPAPTGSNKSL